MKANLSLFFTGVVRTFTIGLVLFTLLMLLVVPVLAQESTTEASPTPAPTEVVLVDPVPDTPPEVTPIDLREIGNALSIAFIETMWRTLQSAGLIPAIVVIVGIIKYVPFIQNWIAERKISLNLLVFVVAVIVWLAAGTATWFGFTEQFTGAVAWIVDVLPKSLQFLTLIIGAPWLHEWAKNRDNPVPVLGKTVQQMPLLESMSASYDGFHETTTTYSDGTTIRTERGTLPNFVRRDELNELVEEQVKLKLAQG